MLYPSLTQTPFGGVGGGLRPPSKLKKKLKVSEDDSVSFLSQNSA